MWVAPLRKRAAIAQSVEHIIRNDGVAGSNPVCGTSFFNDLALQSDGSIFLAHHLLITAADFG